MAELNLLQLLPLERKFDYMSEVREIDVDLGDTNDFQFQLPVSEWTKGKYWYENRYFYYPTRSMAESSMIYSPMDTS